MNIYPDDLMPVLKDEILRQAEQTGAYFYDHGNAFIAYDGEIDLEALAERILEIFGG